MDCARGGPHRARGAEASLEQPKWSTAIVGKMATVAVDAVDPAVAVEANAPPAAVADNQSVETGEQPFKSVV